MIRRPPRSTLSSSSAASDVYKRQRKMCRRANRIIVESRRDHYTTKIRDASGDPRRCWSEIRNTLHSPEPRIVRSPDESKKLSNDFAAFFLDKVRNIKTAIKQRIFAVCILTHCSPMLDIMEACSPIFDRQLSKKHYLSFGQCLRSRRLLTRFPRGH